MDCASAITATIRFAFAHHIYFSELTQKTEKIWFTRDAVRLERKTGNTPSRNELLGVKTTDNRS